MPEKRHAGLRKFNRTIFNPIIKLFAGRFLYALVRHTGRRSGKAYGTPVVAARKDDSIFIPLPYGADTDWLLNVLARRGCAVMHHGTLYSAGQPEVVAPAAALPAFPPIFQKAFRRSKIEQYLHLRIQA
jgi:deazaflavin-dependent oxidoreductase (nitroreductase family)